MSKIGVSTPRKTKFKPASNNPFQGPTAVSFNYNREPFPPAFLTYDGSDPDRAIKNSMFAFIIERVGGVNRYGDNSELRMRVAQAQNLTEETGINLNFGVNNDTVLAGTDGIATIEVQAFMGNGKENLPFNLYEMTCSGMTHAGAPNDPSYLRVPGTYSRDLNYGLIDINWGKKKPEVTLSVKTPKLDVTTNSVTVLDFNEYQTIK